MVRSAKEKSGVYIDQQQCRDLQIHNPHREEHHAQHRVGDGLQALQVLPPGEQRAYLESSETLLRPRLRLPVTLVAEGDVFTKPPRLPSIRPETPSVRSFMNLIGLPRKSVEPAWDNPVVLGNYGAQEGRFLFISFISRESLFDFWTLSLTWLRQIFKQKFGKLFDQNPPPPQKFANFFLFFLQGDILLLC